MDNEEEIGKMMIKGSEYIVSVVICFVLAMMKEKPYQAATATA